jgi:drug/metabolite transporter (DMT)-like permease
LLRWSVLVATALFLLGCILMVGSGGDDATLSNGKKIMKASLIGLAIVLASWLILSTAVYFIAGTGT